MWGRAVYWIFIIGMGGIIFWYTLGRDLPANGLKDGSTVSGDSIARPGPRAFVEVPSHSGSVSPEIEGLLTRIHRARERLKKDPNDIEALIILGNGNYDIHRYDQAKEYYSAALKLDSTNVHVRTDLASCYRVLGDSDRAVQELETALRIDPTHGTALYNLGVIYLNDHGKSDEAIRVWEAFVKFHPDDPMAGGIREKIQELKQ